MVIVVHTSASLTMKHLYYDNNITCPLAVKCKNPIRQGILRYWHIYSGHSRFMNARLYLKLVTTFNPLCCFFFQFQQRSCKHVFKYQNPAPPHPQLRYKLYYNHFRLQYNRQKSKCKRWRENVWPVRQES